MVYRLRISHVLLLGLSMIWALSAQARVDTWQLNMYQGVTPISQDMYHLHMIAMLVCAGIGLIVFGVMIYSLIYHRKSKGFVAAEFYHNTRLEIIWSIIPFIILVGLAIPATKVLMRMDNTQDSDITIKVVGSQWKWQYQYLDQGISFFSNLATPYSQVQNEQQKNPWYLLEVDKPLVLPVNQKIRFIVTSTDVIHSWWIPELGIKRDAMPGFIYEAWATITKPGTYRGQCTELCGINHAYMPIVVKAVSQAQFKQWVEAQPKVQNRYASTTPVSKPVTPSLTKKALLVKGKKTYERMCLACHQADGRGIPPLYPALRGSSIAIGRPISRHVQLILNGVPGTAMQAYHEQLNDEEIAAVVTYERNAWENNTGDVVQPDDVAKERLRYQQAPKIIKKKAQAGGFR
ncbi:MAG: cytochrome c oxidase subunit II [Legionellaceae bacterium]|nr:cytochrome c oxidase subunit II [Legionellaceae bacterium]